jgi:cation diffusion facilitator CzcD-associated flavoprotein CzcO
METMRFDAAVIGGGEAGLAAAVQPEFDREYTYFEIRKRLSY